MIPKLIPLQDFSSKEKGGLGVVEASKEIGFQPKRLYYLFDVPDREDRGQHAHKELYQFMIALHGSFEIELEGKGKNLYFKWITL